MNASHNFTQKLRDELKSVAAVTLFFLVWLGTLTGLKTLVLAEYHVQFREFTFALVGALVLAKVGPDIFPMPQPGQTGQSDRASFHVHRKRC